MMHWRFAALAACVALSACASGASPSLPRAGFAGRELGGPSSPIQHVIVMVQENRTFNDFFATFPGAAGTTTGKMRVNGQTVDVALSKVGLWSKNTLRRRLEEIRLI